ncbi:MAG TPA: DUF937 domain-containing protein, partial [Steroidobacteraceae bacterium]|nr:DUF937 domain-containing protein [Steroidobacteraceae bacterium]
MGILDMIGGTGGLRSIARELGVDEAQVSAAAAALLPAILGGMKRQTQAQPSGPEGLLDVLGGLGGGGLLDDVLGPQPTNINRGNDLLGQIFGSRDVSRTVAGSAATRTGLDPALLKRMLPMLAMLVGGFLARQHGGASAQPGGQADSLGLDSLLG